MHTNESIHEIRLNNDLNQLDFSLFEYLDVAIENVLTCRNQSYFSTNNNSARF